MAAGRGWRATLPVAVLLVLASLACRGAEGALYNPLASSSGTTPPKKASKTVKGAKTDGKQSWANEKDREVYMTMYNEYHKMRTGKTVCHGCRYLPAVLSNYKFTTVVDAGAGNGMLVRQLLAAGKDARGVEAASHPLETFAPDLLANGTVYVTPMQFMPFDSGFADFIMSTEVLEHVPEKDIDASIKEMARVTKPGAEAFVTIGMSKSRFDSKSGRSKSEVASIAMDFQFHETVKDRRWWIDTFCAHGWVETPPLYTRIVRQLGGMSRGIPPRNWFTLKKVGRGQTCKCWVPPGRQEKWFCGEGRPSALKDAMKA